MRTLLVVLIIVTVVVILFVRATPPQNETTPEFFERSVKFSKSSKPFKKDRFIIGVYKPKNLNVLDKYKVPAQLCDIVKAYDGSMLELMIGFEGGKVRKVYITEESDACIHGYDFTVYCRYVLCDHIYAGYIWDGSPGHKRFEEDRMVCVYYKVNEYIWKIILDVQDVLGRDLTNEEIKWVNENKDKISTYIGVHEDGTVYIYYDAIFE